MKYVSVDLFVTCPHCKSTLKLYVRSSWTDFVPEDVRCPHCKTLLHLDESGNVKEGCTYD